jgi:hypothetical protein
VDEYAAEGNELTGVTPVLEEEPDNTWLIDVNYFADSLFSRYITLHTHD